MTKEKVGVQNLEHAHQFIVGSILQIEPKRLCSGYKPEPAVGTTGTHPFLKKGCVPVTQKLCAPSCKAELSSCRQDRPLRLCGELLRKNP